MKIENLRYDAKDVEEFFEQEHQLDVLTSKLVHEIREFECCGEIFPTKGFISKLRKGNTNFRFVKYKLDEALDSEEYLPSKANYKKLYTAVYERWHKNDEALPEIIRDEIKKLKEEVKIACDIKKYAFLYNPESGNLFDEGYLFVGSEKDNLKNEVEKFLGGQPNLPKGELVEVLLDYEKDFYDSWSTIIFKDGKPYKAYIMTNEPDEAKDGEVVSRIKYYE